MHLEIHREEEIEEIVNTGILDLVHCNLQKHSEFSFLPMIFPNLGFHIKSLFSASSLR